MTFIEERRARPRVPVIPGLRHTARELDAILIEIEGMQKRLLPEKAAALESLNKAGQPKPIQQSPARER